MSALSHRYAGNVGNCNKVYQLHTDFVAARHFIRPGEADYNRWLDVSEPNKDVTYELPLAVFPVTEDQYLPGQRH